MAIIENIHTTLVKITPEEISDYLDSDFSQRSDFIADALSFDKSRGDNNTTPREPSTLGIKGLIDASNFWTARTNSSARYSSASATQTTDTQLVFGGTPTTTNNDQFTDSTNAWAAKTSMNSPRIYHSCGMQSADLCFSVGGYNNSVWTGVTERFSNSGNSWLAKTSFTSQTRGYGVCGSMNSDAFVLMGGSQGGSAYSNTDKYTISSDSWAARTGLNTASDTNGGGSLTTDISVEIQGTGAKTQRFSDSMNFWTNRIAMDLYALNGGAIFSSDVAMVFGGQNGSTRLSNSIRYTDSANTYSFKAEMMGYFDRRYTGVGTLSSENSLAVGGYNSAYNNHTEIFTDKSVGLLSGLSWISSEDSFINTLVGKAKVITKTLRTTIPSKIIVGGLYSQLDKTLKPTIDISGDGGSTWPLTDISFNQAVNTSSLSGSDFRLRINLPRLSGFTLRPGDLINANTWSSRTAMPIALDYPGSANTGDFSALQMSGLNGTTFGNSAKFYDIQNSWTTRTANGTARSGGSGGSLSNDLSLYAGGRNAGSVSVSTTDRFSDSGNAWISRGNKTVNTAWSAPFTLTSDRVVVAGGFTTTQVNTVDRFIDSGNSWSSVVVLPISKLEDFSGAALTTDLGCTFGGYVSPTTIDTIYRYSDSGQTWATRCSLSMITLDSGASEISSDLILCFGGNNNSINLNINHRYSDSSNSVAARQRMTFPKSAMCYSALSSGIALSAGGTNGSYLANTERFVDGETFMQGFALKYV